MSQITAFSKYCVIGHQTLHKETKGLAREKHRTLARTIQKDWQKRKNGLSDAMWSDGHLEFFVATITRVAKALTFQQWPSE
jgi:hypothetical protein